MFRSKAIELKIGVAAALALALCLFVTGCGDTTNDDGVRARNLLTGEVKDFASEGDVPPDWVTCSSLDCPVPPNVPCQKLSEKVCTLNPSCRLKVMWCQGSGVINPDGTESSDGTPGTTPGGSADDGTPGTTPPPPPPPQCKYQCIPKLPLLCEELADEKQCAARTDCDWLQGPCPACPAICEDDGNGGCKPCAPCPFSCQTKAPPICQQLDKNQCLARPDCNWDQLACPMVCEDDGNGGCKPCPDTGTCNPKMPVPPPCPTIPGPPPGYCSGGKIVYDNDAAGCVVGYHCEMPKTCWDLNKAYINAVKEAKTCNPFAMMPGNQCAKMVTNALFCPVCPTFVNPANSAALSKMAAAEAKWKALSCDLMEIACPAIACPAPQSATCLPNGTSSSGGSCVDDQPTP